jgi:4Fe-4S ferredoxin
VICGFERSEEGENHGKVEGQSSRYYRGIEEYRGSQCEGFGLLGGLLDDRPGRSCDMRRTMRKPEPNCKFDPAVMVPVIDPMRCEAAGPCVPICPYDVLLIRTVPPDEKAKLPLMGRFKLLVHGGKQAFVDDPDSCRGCGLCVKACPENAIKLQKQIPQDGPFQV